MKIGVIARAENRGLGIQTHEVCRHLNPDRVLLIEPTHSPWPIHADWYDGWDTTTVRWPRRDDGLDERRIRRWLSGLDVIYTAETLYDWRIPSWFRGGVVCHANPEMLRPDRHHAEGVTWWSATPWLLEAMPAGTRVVPMPAPTDRFPTLVRPSTLTRFLHVAGHGAMRDRNGSTLVAKALQHFDGPATVTITHQDDVTPKMRGRTGVTVTKAANVEHWWDQYADADVLVMPRRFGGLCLPVIEALAAGLVVLMSDCSPNDVWPGPRIPIATHELEHAVGGMIPLCSVDPEQLAKAMTVLCDPAVLDEHRLAARSWVEANSWDALIPLWRSELERACR